MLPQKILKSWCSETPFLVFWEDKFCPKCSLNQLSFLWLFLLTWLRVEVVDFILYKSCGFWNYSGYHFQLSILCLVSLYEYHKNSFENFRAVEIWNFPIPNAYWSEFGIFEENRKDHDEISMIQESSQTYYFLWPHLRLTCKVKWFSFFCLRKCFKFSTVVLITVGNCRSCFKRPKQKQTALYSSYGKHGCDNSRGACHQTSSLPYGKRPGNFSEPRLVFELCRCQKLPASDMKQGLLLWYCKGATDTGVLFAV